MGVEILVPQMQDTLSQIRVTVDGLSTQEQSERLNQLEHKRERLLADLRTSFDRESQDVETKREAKLDEIRKKRKQEDEEREARRRQEDEELRKTNSNEDTKRKQKLDNETDSVEDETEQQMDEIEESARKMIEEGKQKLKDLEEKRRELNRRIDEQLQESVPTAPTRKRARPKQDLSSSPRDSTARAVASTGPGDHVSSTKTDTSDTNKSPTPTQTTSPAPKDSRTLDKKADKPPKFRPSAVESVPAKAPEAKQHGELPFQDRSSGHPQAAKESAKNLPMSFAEAVKNNVSNGSKEIPQHGRSQSDRANRSEDSRGDRNTVLRSSGAGEIIVQSSGTAELAEIENRLGENNETENRELLPKMESAPRINKQISSKESKTLVELDQIPSFTPEDAVYDRWTESQQMHPTDAQRQSSHSHTEIHNHRPKSLSMDSNAYSLASENSPWFEEKRKSAWWTGSPSRSTEHEGDESSNEDHSIDYPHEPRSVKHSVDSTTEPKMVSEGKVQTRQLRGEHTVSDGLAVDKLYSLHVSEAVCKQSGKGTQSDQTSGFGDAHTRGRQVRNKTPPNDEQLFPKRPDTPVEQVKSYTSSNGSEAEVHPVDSKSAIQPSGLSSTPEKRGARYDDKQDDQMELNGTTFADSPEQEPSVIDLASVKPRVESLDSSHIPNSSPLESNGSLSPASLPGDAALSFDTDLSDITPGSGTPTEFESPHYPNVHNLFAGQQAQGGSASPLPVENETVCGQDQLFDDDYRSGSITSESIISDSDSDMTICSPIANGEADTEQSLERTTAEEEIPVLTGGSHDRTVPIKQADDGASQPPLPKPSHVQQNKDFEEFGSGTINQCGNARDASHDRQYTPMRVRRQATSLEDQPSGASEDENMSFSHQIQEPACHQSQKSPMSVTHQPDSKMSSYSASEGSRPGSGSTTNTHGPSPTNKDTNLKPTHQTPSSSPTLTSPSHLKLPKDQRSRSSSPSRPQATDLNQGQGPSPHRYASGKKLYSQALSGRKSNIPQEQDSRSHRVPLVGSGQLKHKLRSSSAEAHPKRQKQQRGRQRNKSLQLPVRGFNPRVQLFQGFDEDIDIASPCFKHTGVLKPT